MSCNLDSEIVSGDKIQKIKNIISKKGVYTFVLFYHPSCGHCVRYKPILERYRQGCMDKKIKNVQMVFINHETAPELFSTSIIPGIDSINSYPQTFIFYDGKVIGHVEGADEQKLAVYMKKAGL